jgi:O-antigen ligase
MAKNDKTIKKKYKYDLWIILPLIFTVAIIPLIIYLKVVAVPEELKYFTNGQDNADFFSYYKMLCLSISAFVGLLMFFSRWYLNKQIELRKDKFYYPMFIYAVLIILSVLFSSYKSVATKGFIDRYEGMYALLSYLSLMFLAYNTVDNEKQVKTLIYSLSVSSLVMALIGLTQFLGKDIFMTDFGKSLILPKAYEPLKDTLNFTFAASKATYGTLYNINYVGVYTSMIFTISITLVLLLKDKKQKLFFLLVSAANFLTLLGSRSRAALLSFGVYIVLAIIFYRRQIKHSLRFFTLAFIVILVIFFGVNSALDGTVTDRLISGVKSLIEVSYIDFEDVVLEDDAIDIKFTDHGIRIVNEDGFFTFYDELGNPLEVEMVEEGTYKPTKEPYNKHTFKLLMSDTSGLIVQADLATNKGVKSIRFAYDENNSPKALGYRGELLRNDEIRAEHFNFEGREYMASNRGYIWSRSIPLIKDTIFIGHGPDTYGIYFPNNDFVGKIKGLNSIYTVVDKPHNMYLQTAINTGLVSLLAELSIFIMYIITSFKAYFKKDDYHDFIEVTGLGIFFAVCMYLFTGLSNDSIVSVAPIFWVLLGTGFIINRKLIEKEKGIA